MDLTATVREYICRDHEDLSVLALHHDFRLSNDS